MEVKDTIIDAERIYEIYDETKKFQGCGGVPEYELVMLREQAEISFKAGREEERKGGTNAIAFLEGVQEGRKDVVDCLMETADSECENEDGETCITFWFTPEEWKDKLKEWEL